MRHWTTMERSEVARLLRAGLTARQIASRFEGRTKSAVISFVNRDPMLREIGFTHDSVYFKGGQHV